MHVCVCIKYTSVSSYMYSHENAQQTCGCIIGLYGNLLRNLRKLTYSYFVCRTVIPNTPYIISALCTLPQLQSLAHTVCCICL